MWNPRVLFLFGTYTIGKERLFLQVGSGFRVDCLRAGAGRLRLSNRMQSGRGALDPRQLLVYAFLLRLV